ncbi:MAG: arginine--tRNA ligase, partial [Clostridiales bacterium]|nr:arginine--tRNA ligase [Clostridiales bacterium]
EFDRNIYVVGLPQALHFRQVFSVLGLLGFEWSRDCIHVGFGHVRLPEGKMATREGEVIPLEDVLNEAVRRAAAMMDAERKAEDPQKVAEAVGVGAMVYTFLKNSRERDIIFSWDEMLDLEGESGPYLQYTYARASSVLRRAEAAGGLPDDADYARLTSDEEFELVDLMNAYPDTIFEAAQKYEPSILARHVMAIARAYNKFYHFNNILDAAPGVREARLHLCQAARTLLGTGLTLLGIERLERM